MQRSALRVSESLCFCHHCIYSSYTHDLHITTDVLADQSSFAITVRTLVWWYSDADRVTAKARSLKSQDMMSMYLHVLCL